MKKQIIILSAVLLLSGCQTATTDQTVYTVSDINEKGSELLSSEQTKKDVRVEGVIVSDTLEDEDSLAGILVSDEMASDTI